MFNYFFLGGSRVGIKLCVLLWFYLCGCWAVDLHALLWVQWNRPSCRGHHKTKPNTSESGVKVRGPNWCHDSYTYLTNSLILLFVNNCHKTLSIRVVFGRYLCIVFKSEFFLCYLLWVLQVNIILSRPSAVIGRPGCSCQLWAASWSVLPNHGISLWASHL